MDYDAAAEILLKEVSLTAVVHFLHRLASQHGTEFCGDDGISRLTAEVDDLLTGVDSGVAASGYSAAPFQKFQGLRYAADVDGSLPLQHLTLHHR